MKRFKHVLLYISILSTFGCATSFKTPSLQSIKNQSSEKGLVLLSSGRKEKSGFMQNYPFVDYLIFRIESDIVVSEGWVEYISAEPFGEVLTHPKGHIGKDRYVFVHVIELPEGEYLLAGKNRANPMVQMYYPSINSMPTRNGFTFIVERNALNYIGELLTVDDYLNDPNSIQINNEFERDLKYVSKSVKGITELPTKLNLANRIPLLETK